MKKLSFVLFLCTICLAACTYQTDSPDQENPVSEISEVPEISDSSGNSEITMIQKPGMYGPHKDERGRTIEHPDLSWNEILELGYLKLDHGVLYTTFDGDGGSLASENLQGTLVLPEGIFYIADQTFRATHLKKIVLPEGLSGIGYEAFCEAETEEMNLPSSVQFIDYSAFLDADKLKKKLDLKNVSVNYSNKKEPLTGWNYHSSENVNQNYKRWIARFEDGAGWDIYHSESHKPENSETQFYYFTSKDNNSVWVWKVKLNAGNEKLEIPEEIEGKPVKKVGYPEWEVYEGNKNILEENTDHKNTISQVILPYCVEKLTAYTFAGFSALTEFHVPADLADMKKNVFKNCGKLRNFTVDKNNYFYFVKKGKLRKRG